MHVFSLYNKKVPYWNAPTFGDTPKEQVGVTLTRYCIQNEEQARKAHYDECDLYYLGEFDDATGKFELLPQPEFIVGLSSAFPIKPAPEPARFSAQDIQQLAFTLKAYLTQEMDKDE